MIKKIYGVTEKDERVELPFKKFIMFTDNDSEVEINVDIQKHPEGADLALNICTGQLKKIQGNDEAGVCKFEALEGHRYFSVLPGAANLIFIKVVRK